VNRDGEKPERVDTNQVVSEALKNLAVVIEESGAKVTRAELPTVLGNEAQLTQLFQNLVSNAIKFCQDEDPEIDISAREVGQGDDTWWIFSVRDNGPGIAEEHHQRIYQVFQRLDPSRDIKGTGIGLALCRRIVELHGGEITVDSAPGHGSVFKFNLPGISA
jgi:signal transduction histidine kinase